MKKMKFELGKCKRCNSFKEAFVKVSEYNEPTCYEQSHIFKITKLQMDKDNKTFYDFVIPICADVLSEFRSNMRFKIVIGQKEKILDVIDYIIFTAAPYTVFKCRFYITNLSDLHFRLSYNCIFLPNHDLIELCCKRIITDYLVYDNRICSSK